MGAGVGRRGQRGRGDRVGAAAARVDGGESAGGRGAVGVQARLAERTDGPGVVVVRRQSRLASVQPREPGTVEEVRPADLGPSQASCTQHKSSFNLIQGKKRRPAGPARSAG